MNYLQLKVQKTLRKAGAIQNICRKGYCWDNAAAKSFFKTINSVLINPPLALSESRKRSQEYLITFKSFTTAPDCSRH
jgi:transposase InsO family protein